MKIKNNTILCIFALTALATTFGSCQSEDDALNGLPQGSVPLVLGDVTVAGAQTVNNRAAGGSTRAAIAENAAGYTGIRKSRFVNGDVLNLTLTNDGGTTNTPVTATLTGGKWVLTPGKVFITPGVTKITATHTAVEQTAGIATDDLAAAHADCVLTAASGTLAIAMKHAGAMIDITTPGVSVAFTSIKVNTDVATEPEEEATADGGSGTTMHYRTLTAATTVVSSISAEVGSTTYVATLATPLTVAANKRYPVALTFNNGTLTATVSAPQDWTNGGTIKPAGYTYIIDSPETLAQFAQDVNDDAAGTGARAAIVLQTKDIDLSKLKPAAEAGINPMTGAAYNYTATAESWVPIASTAIPFKGKYNGNGHTISNMKITAESYSAGLFGGIESAALTGINLRNGSITKIASGGRNCGMLAADVKTSVVSLCSATGTIDVQEAGNAGGLIGHADASHITRCSANVQISNTTFNLSTFISSLDNNSLVLGCSSTGDIMSKATTSATSTYGFTYGIGTVMGCYFGGATMECVYFNAINNISCYALAGSGGYGTGGGFTACAYSGICTLSGVTGEVTGTAAYAALIATNASVADVKTLHWSKEDGYTLDEVIATWYAADVWKDNGTAAPTIDMTYEGYDGPLYNGQPANLLAILGQTAYYVAPTDASTGTLWKNINFDTICPTGWHVPTNDEFRAMTGIKTAGSFVDTNHAEIKAAFPENSYWTSYGVASSYIYFFEVSSTGTKIASITDRSKHVRCVQAKS